MTSWGLLTCADILAVDILLTSFERGAHGIGHIHMPRFGEFDQHGQVRAVDDPAVFRAASQEAEVRGGAAEKIGDNHHTGALAIRPLEALGAWVRGITGVYYAIAILILAWAIKEVCTDVGTSTYLTAALSPLLSPGLLPVLIFGLASLVAFSIGTSWTTMAILIPTVVPLAHAMGGITLTALVAAAVLDGAIFGDHCSPISDTTVLSSIASSCDHLAHVRTQAPYALTTMVAAGLCGYLGSTLFWSPVVGLALGLVFIIAVLLLIGKKTDED